MREVLLKCPITGKRQKIIDPEGEPTVLDIEEGSDLPEGWGEVIVRRVMPNPAYAPAADLRAQMGEQLNAQIDEAAGQMGASAEEVAAARRAVPSRVDRDLPLPAEFVTVEWAFSALSPEGMDSVGEEMGKLGLTMQPIPSDQEAPAEEEPAPEA